MSVRPPRILFRARSRRGLGHLARGLNLARAIQSLDGRAEIAFHVSNAGAAAFCPPAFACVVESEAEGATSWHDAVAGFDPDIAVFDTVLKASDLEGPQARRRVFVMRKTYDARQADLLSSGALARMDLIVVPHQEAEFDQALPEGVRERTAFVGPIVRLPDQQVQDALRHKYAIAPGDFVLTSTVGGGGFEETAARVYDTAWAAHERLLPALPSLRHIVVLGPQSKTSRQPLPRMTVVQSEPELVNLLAVSALVVAEGGYNTVNEIRAVRTPAVFIPGARTYDDQEERVRALEARGLARVLGGMTIPEMAGAVAELATSPAALEAMRRRYAAEALHPGNLQAARQILALAS